eukprot:14237963-Alexandrium_andersonii.AAC.1
MATTETGSPAVVTTGDFGHAPAQGERALGEEGGRIPGEPHLKKVEVLRGADDMPLQEPEARQAVE